MSERILDISDEPMVPECVTWGDANTWSTGWMSVADVAEGNTRYGVHTIGFVVAEDDENITLAQNLQLYVPGQEDRKCSDLMTIPKPLIVARYPLGRRDDD